ncbi:MAG: hypothetical protein IKF72_00665 [Kiritimatiellae bacterium]|nr:hypothetical protein [Kiritimatiellia bacterium]
MSIVSCLPFVVLAAGVFLPRSVLHAAEPWTLQTEEGGNVLFPAGDAKFQPMQRRADDSFKRYVAKVEADPSDSSCPRLKWTFPTRGEGEKNAIVLTLDAERWAGGQCMAGAETDAIPKEHKKGKNIHIAGHVAQTFRFKDELGRSFRLDFGEEVRLHAMDGREWDMGEFMFRFYCDHDIVTVALDAGGPVSVSACKPFKIVRGDKWIPLKVKCEIKEGSALDFATVVPTVAPCRRVVARGRHFEFEDSPGVVRRFYGVNVCNNANFAKREVAAAFVRQLRRRGYNALRFHHHDNGMVEGSADGTKINPGQIDRMDAFLAECGKAGVHVTTDLFVSRKVPRRSIGQDEDGFLGMDEYKALTLVSEGAFSNLCAFARQWMAHVNPYTGLRWADDPTLALLAFVNEGHVGMDGAEALRKYPEYAAAWKKWATETGCEMAEIPSGKPWNKTPEMDAFAKFVATLEERFAVRMRTFLKDELGVKALVSDMSSGFEREPFRAVRKRHYDYVDEHCYWDHPTWPGDAWRTPVKSMNTNPIRVHGADVLDLCSRVAVNGKPFVTTEYNFVGPSEYRHMAGLVAGAQAAREDWAGMWRFDWGGSQWEMAHIDQVRSGLFAMSGDALARVDERVAMCLFLRGDLAAGGGEAAVANRETGAFSVSTARTSGGFAEDGRIMAGAVAALCDNGPVAVWATSLDGMPLSSSCRMLVAHLTDLANDGDTYEDESRTMLLRWGKPPHLVRAGVARLALALGQGDFRVYALDTSGERVREVPCRIARGRLRFTADVAADPENATFLYEVTR